MNNVVKFYPADAAKNPDNVLEQSIGIFSKVIVLGADKDDLLDVRASTNFTTGEIIMCLEQFKYNLLSGVYDMECLEEDD